MPEWQFVQWQHYAARRMLPHRRIEMHLAQLAMWVAKGAGVNNLGLSDFLFDPPEPESDEPLEPVDPAVAAEYFGFSPRK